MDSLSDGETISIVGNSTEMTKITVNQPITFTVENPYNSVVVFIPGTGITPKGNYVNSEGNRVYTFVSVDNNSDVNPIVNPSNNSTSSGTSSSTTNNVVTCQMAGYPAGYNWNEAAKACQAGYADDNGVWHSTNTATTTRKTVANTYDKGLTGSIASLITASVIALFSAFILIRH